MMRCAASLTFHCQAYNELSHEEHEKRYNNDRWNSKTSNWRRTTSQAEVKGYAESLRQRPEPAIERRQPKSATPVDDLEMNEFAFLAQYYNHFGEIRARENHMALA